MSKIIVTGGAGFIGSHLVDELVKNSNHKILVLDNLSTGNINYVNKSADLIMIGLNDMEDLEAIFHDFKPDYVFHLAALPRIQPSIKDPIESHKVNVEGFLNILELSRKYKVKKFIYSASSSAYGDQEKMPLREDMKPEPKNPYALQKYVGEQYCQLYSKLYGLPTVCLRYFNVYGKRQSCEGAYATVIGVFLKQKAEGKKFTVVGNGIQKRDFTHVSDIVKANILAMNPRSAIKGEVINIGCGDNISINELADLIGGKKEYIPKRPGESKETLANNKLAKELLGWTPVVNIEEGIKLCESI